MIPTVDEQTKPLEDATIIMLHELQISIRRLGYKCLTVAVPCYARNDTQSLSKELYPYVAGQLPYAQCHSVERAIRTAVLDAWTQRDPAVWERYFPRQTKVPTNKQFIAVLAERLR